MLTSVTLALIVVSSVARARIEVACVTLALVHVASVALPVILVAGIACTLVLIARVTLQQGKYIYVNLLEKDSRHESKKVLPRLYLSHIAGAGVALTNVL